MIDECQFIECLKVERVTFRYTNLLGQMVQFSDGIGEVLSLTISTVGGSGVSGPGMVSGKLSVHSTG
jgi:hypothetical protein